MKYWWWVIGGLWLLTACHVREQPENMQEILRQTAEQYFFVPENPYASSVRIRYLDSLLRQAPPSSKNQYKYRMAEALLYGGSTREAIQQLQELIRVKNTGRFVLGLEDYQEDRLESLLALAYLRLGEQQNCILNHTSASCIIPIQATGVHQLTEGSQKAIEILEQILQNDSRDLHSRWLLNVAYMTLGKYPEQVPEEWVIPEKALASEYPLKKFPDIAPQLGLAIDGLSGGVVVDDFTNDGYLDVLASTWFADEPLRFFTNGADGTFSEKTEEAGLPGITGGLNMVQADYDNDGWLDVLVLRGAWLGPLGKHPNSLLHNNGDGTFTDVTLEAGLLSFHPTQTATWNDFNNDGWLDVFIGNESTSPEDIHASELYLNQQDGTFREVAALAGVTVSQPGMDYFVKGVNSGDYNNDGRQDLFVSALDGNKRNILFRNEGTNDEGVPLFKDVTVEAGLGENISSFPTWFFDYNNDGWLDIFVAGYNRSSNVISSVTYDIAAEYLGLPFTAETARLYQNKGDGTFQNVTEQVGLDRIAYAMGANFGDLDNDGYLDMYMSTGEVNFASIIPNRMFRNEQGSYFQDVTSSGGFGHLQKGHAVSFADLDQDGDQDIYVVMGGAYEGDHFQNVLFENPYQQENAWITIALSGTQANKRGVGSRLILEIEEESKKRKIYRDMNSGGSFGCSPLRLQVGLGKATLIQSLTIQWAGSGRVQTFENIPVNQYIKIEEGGTTFYPVNLPALPWQPKEESEHSSHQLSQQHTLKQ